MDSPTLTSALLTSSTILYWQCWREPSAPPTDKAKNRHGAAEKGVTPRSVLVFLLLLRVPFVIWNLAWLATIYADPTPTNVTYLSPTVLVGFAVFLTGCALRLWAFYTLGVHFTFIVAIRDGHKLIKTGPYRYVRHPSYTAFILLWPGLILAYMSYQGGNAVILRRFLLGQGLEAWGIKGVLLVWSMRVITCVFLYAFAIVGDPPGRFRRLKHEEGVLHRAFGKEWEDYVKTTYALVPGIY